ncbi:hypothetical protein ABTZ59_02590 [Streptomyces sp. NPDC094034]|uniref:hypothetical protein n=1 Tax=Streptomyces sp. NPDC094034 TaxID=3155309 RepID=UPI00331F55A6
MNPRDARIRELVEEHADKRKNAEQFMANYRDQLLRQARNAIECGDHALATAKWERVLTVGESDKELPERQALLLDWMNDPLVWVRPSNPDDAEIYHFSKNCGHVQRGNPKQFMPRLEGEVKKHRKPCTTRECRAALYVWQNAPRSEAA